MQQCVVRAINQVIGDKDGFLVVLQKNIATVFDVQGGTEGIDARLEELQKELLCLANTGSQYLAVAEDICKLRELKQSALFEKSDRQTKRQSIV